ncbi:hypothetical protein VTN00DRAFT_4924 [Thermoascus crustaceus]|uniref:uncharacterized protein n=1 Tax=Thermoascus crustaceus TaxID=5088 RepID=UPI003742FE41
MNTTSSCINIAEEKRGTTSPYLTLLNTDPLAPDSAADELGGGTPHFQAWRAVAFAAHVLIHVNDGHYYAVAHLCNFRFLSADPAPCTRDTSTETSHRLYTTCNRRPGERRNHLCCQADGTTRGCHSSLPLNVV